MEQKAEFDRQHKKQQPTHDRYGRLRKDTTQNFGQWIRDAVQKLIEHNHRLDDIAEYPLDRFVTFLLATDRTDARNRLMYISDMSAILGGMFGSEGLGNHIDDLNEVLLGE